jgi:hypothetical protein
MQVAAHHAQKLVGGHARVFQGNSAQGCLPGEDRREAAARMIGPRAEEQLRRLGKLHAGGMDHPVDIERALAAQRREETRAEVGEHGFQIVRIVFREGLERGFHLAAIAQQDSLEQMLLGGEVFVERGLRTAQFGRDRRHRGLAIARLGKDPRGHREDVLTALVGRAALQSGDSDHVVHIGVDSRSARGQCSLVTAWYSFF